MTVISLLIPLNGKSDLSEPVHLGCTDSMLSNPFHETLSFVNYENSFFFPPRSYTTSRICSHVKPLVLVSKTHHRKEVEF